MKRILLISALMFACACTHNTATPNTATCQTQPESEPLPKKDNFDKAGDAFAASSRYMYDEAIHAWRWFSSDEMKAHYSDAWEATKRAANKAYDAAKDTYNEHK